MNLVNIKKIKLNKNFVVVQYKKSKNVAFVVQTEHTEMTEERLKECCLSFFTTLYNVVSVRIVNTHLHFTKIEVETTEDVIELSWNYITGFNQ